MLQEGTFLSETNISVPEETLSPADCKGLADVLATIGDKWTIMVVGTLSRGPLRYNEIRRRIGGVSQRMLTLTLKRLEVDGIVTRTLFPSVPPRVDYELTQLGQTLRGALQPLQMWAATNKEAITLNRSNAAQGKIAVHTEAAGRSSKAAFLSSPRDTPSPPTVSGVETA